MLLFFDFLDLSCLKIAKLKLCFSVNQQAAAGYGS